MSTISRARAVVGSISALMRNRLGLGVATQLEAQELSATIAPDRRLVVLGHEPIAGAPVDHGTVANESAMLALHTYGGTTLLAEPRVVIPGDIARRADRPGHMQLCIGGHGTAAADWVELPLSAALAAGLAALDAAKQSRPNFGISVTSPASFPAAADPSTGGVAVALEIVSTVADIVGMDIYLTDEAGACTQVAAAKFPPRATWSWAGSVVLPALGLYVLSVVGVAASGAQERVDVVLERESLVVADLFSGVRQGTPTAELFRLPAGINEFDLVRHAGYYHFFYTSVGATKHRSATSISALATAPDDVTITGRYPTAIVVDGMWHVWTSGADSRTHHYTAASAAGPYTDTGETLPLNLLDWHVRPLAAGGYCAAYKDTATLRAGVLTSLSVNGPWADEGYIMDSIQRPSWMANEEADPAIVEYGDRTFCTFAAWDNLEQRIAMVEVDPVSLMAIAQPVVIASPTAAWMRENSSPKIFNPVWLDDRIYFAHNASADVESGWGAVMPQIPQIDDGRTDDDVVRTAWAGGRDLATGVPPTLHGSGTISGGALVTTTSTGGAYGPLNATALDDFELTIGFTPSGVTGAYKLLFRASTYTASANPILGVWISPSGGIHLEIHNATGTGDCDMDAGSVTNSALNTLVVRKSAGVVTITLNGSLVGTGSHSTSLVGLTEWAAANQRGRTTAASQQYAGSISSIVLTRLAEEAKGHY